MLGSTIMEFPHLVPLVVDYRSLCKALTGSMTKGVHPRLVSNLFVKCIRGESISASILYFNFLAFYQKKLLCDETFYIH
jgi:hypothetical protein